MVNLLLEVIGVHGPLAVVSKLQVFMVNLQLSKLQVFMVNLQQYRSYRCSLSTCSSIEVIGVHGQLVIGSYSCSWSTCSSIEVIGVHGQLAVVSKLQAFMVNLKQYRSYRRSWSTCYGKLLVFMVNLQQYRSCCCLNFILRIKPTYTREEYTYTFGQLQVFMVNLLLEVIGGVHFFITMFTIT